MSRNGPPPRSGTRVPIGLTSLCIGAIFVLAVLVGTRQTVPLRRQTPASAPPPAPDVSAIVVETSPLQPLVAVNEPGPPTSDRNGGTNDPEAPAPPITGATDLRWVDPHAVPFVADPALTARVAERIAGRSGRYGIALKNLRSGHGVLLDPDGRYQAASLFKLWVMYEVFRQRDAGSLSFGEVLRLTQRHVDYDLGTLDRPAGSTILLGEALERMITISDNSSAILLSDRVGAHNITQSMQRLGLTRSRFAVDDLTTSPGDMLLLLETIARGEAVSRQASAEMIHLLARQRVNDRIPRLLPPETIVAHKTGNLPGVVNDVGIIYGGQQVFVLAVLVDGTGNEAEAARVTAELAAMAYDHFRITADNGDAAARPIGEPIPPPAPWPTPPQAPTQPAPLTNTPTATETPAESTATTAPSPSPTAPPEPATITQTPTPTETPIPTGDPVHTPPASPEPLTDRLPTAPATTAPPHPSPPVPSSPTPTNEATVREGQRERA